MQARASCLFNALPISYSNNLDTSIHVREKPLPCLFTLTLYIYMHAVNPTQARSKKIAFYLIVHSRLSSYPYHVNFNTPLLVLVDILSALFVPVSPP